jgi:CDP-Glycerol:Poly(glycerophosphate) glycerophosphotransferase
MSRDPATALRAVPVRARAAVRRAGGRWVRRLGLLPGGAADRLGEDDQLTDTVLPQPVLVYFPDPPTNLYQLEQWYAPLAALHAELPVVVITQDSRTTRLLRATTTFEVHCVARSATLDGLVARSDIGLALYVAHATSNFAALRHASMAHVYLGHGDSDKGISASNQLKAYDFAFVAGDAAVERIRETLTWYDADARTIKIGRPQLDRPLAGPPSGSPGNRPPRVLYAPTWEGAQPSVRYGSVVSHGAPLLRSLLDAGLDVVYRPHPRTGANDHRVRAADEALRRLATEHPSGRVDVRTPLAEALQDADLLVTDISSLAMDWLPSLKPLVVTTPATEGLEIPASRLLSAVPRLTAAEAPAAAELVRRLLQDDDVAARRSLVEHYLGDTTPGVATARFVGACRSVLDAGRAERRRLAEKAAQ